MYFMEKYSQQLIPGSYEKRCFILVPQKQDIEQLENESKYLFSTLSAKLFPNLSLLANFSAALELECKRFGISWCGK